jgi:MFS family permease
MADVIGRRTMVVLAAALMVVEMLVFAFVPTENVTLLFWLLLLNRVVSGFAEAAASGADEALAYDALAERGQEKEWPLVLAALMRWQGAVFFLVMLSGALLYDAVFINRIGTWFGYNFQLTPAETVRWPVYATLGMSFLALIAACGLQESPRRAAPIVHPIKEAWAQILSSSRWIARTPQVVTVLMAGLCLDSVVRLFLTLGSNYYRLIELPPVMFGLAGAAMGSFGFFLPELAKLLISRRTEGFNFILVGVLSLVGLTGAALGWKLWGFIFMLPIGVAMNLLGTFLSHYLNASVDSTHRATVLSFRGLSLNLAYGAIGLGYAGLGTALRGPTPDETFFRTLPWLPVYLLGTGLAAAWLWHYLRAKIK